MDTLSKIANNLFFVTWIGAIIGHILSLYKPEFRRTIPFIRGLIPNKSDTFYFRMDFLLLPLIGAFLGLFLIRPSEVENAIFTGLTWSGTLIALLKTGSSKNNPGAA